MLKPLSTVVVAASLLAAAFALSVPAQARDEAGPATTASSSEFSARAQSAAPVKRLRRASTYQRRVASAASPVSYQPQCFLFWCTAGGRSYNLLMLGVAY